VTTRYRCNSCGNITRFDVVETTTIRAYHHFSVGGELTVEEPEIITKTVDSVSCRWCGHGKGIEALTDES
jgi:DNA-directed RNA polymerase subunit RPC12/RpoP